MSVMWIVRRTTGGPPDPARRGLSLIEVILALAILGGAMLMLGHLLRLGGRHATAAQELSSAQLYCQGILSQIETQAIPASPGQNMPVPVDPNWLYSVEIQSLDLEGLMAVRVTVVQATDASTRPLSVSMTRWMIDPVWMAQREAEAAAAAAQQQAEQEATGSGA